MITFNLCTVQSLFRKWLIMSLWSHCRTKTFLCRCSSSTEITDYFAAFELSHKSGFRTNAVTGVIYFHAWWSPIHSERLKLLCSHRALDSSLNQCTEMLSRTVHMLPSSVSATWQTDSRGHGWSFKVRHRGGNRFVKPVSWRSYLGSHLIVKASNFFFFPFKDHMQDLAHSMVGTSLSFYSGDGFLWKYST